MAPSTIGTIVVRGGVTLRASPAREACFRIVTDQAEMAKFPEGSPEHRREMLHGDVNEEIQSLEIAAESLADFPDAPWELRLHLARQAWDEVRHARALGNLRQVQRFDFAQHAEDGLERAVSASPVETELVAGAAEGVQPPVRREERGKRRDGIARRSHLRE